MTSGANLIDDEPELIEIAKLLLMLQREWYEHWGQWPTLPQMLSQLEGVQEES